MKLEDIGFYTLSDKRAKEATQYSPLHRCELILTDECNFKCRYCRGLKKDIKGTISSFDALHTLNTWFNEGLRNVRFSGGEPTLYPFLGVLIKACVHQGVKRIAVSSNGSAEWSEYDRLLKLGVNDFSISLDSCCAATGDLLAGKEKSWEKVVKNIEKISKRCYTTIGMVLNRHNIKAFNENVLFAESLGVSDIRIIPIDGIDPATIKNNTLPDSTLEKFPILRYKIKKISTDSAFRGLKETDSKRCWLALDDMAVAQDNHYPCIIYMRERGDPIGKVSSSIRKDRRDWVMNHNCHKDKICKSQCLDFCVAYNNKADSYR